MVLNKEKFNPKIHFVTFVLTLTGLADIFVAGRLSLGAFFIFLEIDLSNFFAALLITFSIELPISNLVMRDFKHRVANSAAF